MEQAPWEGAEDQAEAVAAGYRAGWEGPLRRDRMDSVCVRNAATGNLTK